MCFAISNRLLRFARNDCYTRWRRNCATLATTKYSAPRLRRGCCGRRPWLGWCVSRGFQPPSAGLAPALPLLIQGESFFLTLMSLCIATEADLGHLGSTSLFLIPYHLVVS